MLPVICVQAKSFLSYFSDTLTLQLQHTSPFEQKCETLYLLTVADLKFSHGDRIISVHKEDFL